MAKVKSQKGFTLFTALIAFILIILAMLLVQSMVSTQRSASDIISGISEQEEMQAVADLSRADALQVVNYGIRYDIESYSTKDDSPKDGLPDNPYFMSSIKAINWEDIKLDFMKNRFGIGVDIAGSGQNKQQFASIVSAHLISLLETTGDTRGYSIQISRPQQAVMASILDKTLEKNFDVHKNDVFEVIKCDSLGATHYKGCVGSFYVTLDLSPAIMEDKDYEQLPQVKVEKLIGANQSVRVLKEPVLPRGKIRIYVPTRLFKALAGAREVGFADGSLFTDEFVSAMPKGAFRTAKEMENALTPYVQSRIDAAIASRQLKIPDDDFVLSDYKVIVSPYVDRKDTADEGDDEVKLISIKVDVYFTEGNKKYKVNSNLPNVFGIELYRQFD